ncbi:hypothetical protein FRX31_017817 [Thalictrum thalictroides]|uniref:RNase H type-1 domain-containing protein n=1 Tax=Thalictrum thalictroides TaxID=46969 RepID=A0A7J6W5E0_THATH|nr:hypothetical protein FRX31_017817 [Thalictrum thalictroides]
MFTLTTRSITPFGNIASLLPIPFLNHPLKQSIIVYWTRPLDDFMALNTDGVASGDLVAGGGIIRDKRDHLHLNYFYFYGQGFNNYAKNRAILDGIMNYKEHGFNHVIIYTDSEQTTKWFNKGTPPGILTYGGKKFTVKKTHWTFRFTMCKEKKTRQLTT